MSEKIIEAILASPPDREELVVQLSWRDGGQWGELYREGNEYWIDMYRSEHEAPMRVTVTEMINALALSEKRLRERLEAE